MKYLFVFCAAYAVVVAETTWPTASMLNGLITLAAITLVLLRTNDALVSVAGIGLFADITNTGLPLGTHAMCFVVVGYTVRALVSNLDKRPLHVVCVLGLVFVAATQLVRTIVLARNDIAGIDWQSQLLPIGCGWLLTVAVVGSVRGIAWVMDKAKQRSANGAVGSPVGLSVN